MTRSKLTDSEKLKILDLYRQPRETTTSLAEQYGVSSSTIRRILKDRLSNQEYETLANQKQAGRSAAHVTAAPQPQAQPKLDPDLGADEQVDPPLKAAAAVQEVQPDPVKVPAKPKQRSRKQIATEDTTSVSQDLNNDSPEMPAETTPGTQLELQPKLVIKLREPAGEDESDLFSDSDLEPLDELASDEQDDDLEDDFDDEDDLDASEEGTYIGNRVRAEAIVETLPLSEALMPGTCYLVVDRSAELITRPLNEFADLGTLAPEEVQEKTLPVFDNHRVARRFSNRMQRVVKLPNGNLLQKASSQLSAKGITRLLINGQVYFL